MEMTCKSQWPWSLKHKQKYWQKQIQNHTNKKIKHNKKKIPQKESRANQTPGKNLTQQLFLYVWFLFYVGHFVCSIFVVHLRATYSKYSHDWIKINNAVKHNLKTTNAKLKNISAVHLQ